MSLSAEVEPKAEVEADAGAEAEAQAESGRKPGAEPVADEPVAAAQPVRPARKRRRTARPTVRSAVVVAFLCGVLGFALAAQLRSNEGESQFANARQSDLVRILDELDSREDRLRSEITDLEFRRETISSRAQGSEASLADARRRTTELGILAGTVAAEGPGLMITLIEKPGERLAASTILDTVEELRGAGAEAMQIAGKEGVVVRIGVSTYFADNGDEGIEVDGKRMAGPYVITVIGDPPTMESALRIPGGIVETVGQDGGDAMLAQSRTVRINAVRELRAPKFARPAS